MVLGSVSEPRRTARRHGNWISGLVVVLERLSGIDRHDCATPAGMIEPLFFIAEHLLLFQLDKLKTERPNAQPE